MFVTGKDMVEIGEEFVKLVGVGIPPGKQQQLEADAAKMGEAARYHPIDGPHGTGESYHPGASPNERFGVLQLGIAEKD